MVTFELKQVGVFRKRDKEEDSHSNASAPEEEEDASEFEDDVVLPTKTKSRRPTENRFTQQRLKAYNPSWTPNNILPLYMLVAAVFVIVGGSLLAISSHVDQITIYYQDCTTAAPTDDFAAMPAGHFNFDFHKNKSFNTAPTWRFVDDPSDDSQERGTCQIRFTIPHEIKKSVYVNYLLERFSANHRRYVLSFSEDQIRGKRASWSDIHDNTGINCKVLGRDDNGKIIYPCGLIANSMFNDSYPMELINVNDNTNYSLTNKGINWHSDKGRFKKTKYSPTEVVPPPNWVKMYPEGYNDTNMPNIHEWEEFQNWMRPAAFGHAAKLIRVNKNDSLPAGEYQINIGLHWPVTEYHGKKGVYITHGSSIGGKNPFLGIVYLIGGCLCCGLALILLLFWLFSGRRLGDPSMLSWNQN